MRNILTLLEDATNGKSYKSYKYCADEEIRVPSVAYDENNDLTPVKDQYGETDTTLKEPKDLINFARKIALEDPLFKFFLDGSRRTYKVDDIELNRRIFPIVAGQIGVACVERKSPSSFKAKDA